MRLRGFIGATKLARTEIVEAEEDLLLRRLLAGQPVPIIGSKLKHLLAGLPPDIDRDKAIALWPRVQAARRQHAERSAERYRRENSPFGVLPGRVFGGNALRRHLEYQREERRRQSERETENRRHQQMIDDVLAKPSAQMWSAAQRASFIRKVPPVGYYTRRESIRELDALAVTTTIKSLIGLAKSLGWTVRHTSRTHGGLSVYLVRGPHGGEQIRLSNHELPTAEDRPWSIKAQERADRPRSWREILVDADTLERTAAEWRGEFV